MRAIHLVRCKPGVAWAVYFAIAGTFACSSSNTTATTPTADAASAADGDGAALQCATANAVCDDGNACTTGDHCEKAVCVGTAVDCADGITCTDDSCVPATGCLHAPVAKMCVISGSCVDAGLLDPADPCRKCQPANDAHAYSIDPNTVCDDGDPCTSGDACGPLGKCAGKPMLCDDANPCTLDSCQAGAGCVSTPGGTASCNDNNPCTLNDACLDGICQGGSAKLACDDANPCTKDSCDSKVGCTAALDPLACDDKQPCTVDSCDPVKGCSHSNLKAGDPCTSGDLCVYGETCTAALTCVGGLPLPCDDNNLCTDDSCMKTKGCIHALNSGSCDDGFDCTTPDLCTGGVCKGIKTASCAKCQKFFSDTEGKLTVFQIGKNGKPGEGIDVDGNPNTCAPSGTCTAGIDNACAMLGAFVNQSLIKAIADGSMTFIAEFEGYTGPDKPFTLNLFYAELSPESLAAGCDGQKQVCSWLVSQAAFGPDCKPKFTFANAVVSAGHLTAGGADTLFAMDAALLGAKNTTLFVKGARIEADVKFDTDGIQLLSVSGVLGGAVPQKALLDVINSLDPSVFAASGLSLSQVVALIQDALTLDIDIDGNGVPEAASIGLRFSAMGAKVVGVSG